MKRIRNLNPDRIREVIDLAEFIGLEYQTSGKINPERIAWKKNISFSYGSYKEGFDGLLQYKNHRFHIYINLERVRHPSFPRSRFTFAHELGHYFIDEHRNELKSGNNLYHPSKCEYQSDLHVEKEADLFASHLLMPNFLFERRIKMWSIYSGLTLIKKISSSFSTSLTSTAIRFAHENLISCGVFKWNPSGELAWYWLSDDLFRKCSGSCKTKIGLLGTLSASYQAFHQKHKAISKGRDVYSNQASSLTSFFPFVPSQLNLKLNEDAIKLGDWGVLTFVYK